MTQVYGRWAELYEAFEGEASADTWRRGIIVELQRRACDEHTLLDLGAGTGIGQRTLTEAFPRCRVISLDRSSAMLDCGRVPADRRVIADMSLFDLGPTAFDFVVSGFDALNCLDEHRLARCLECVARTLKPGGIFVFDYSSPKLLREDWADLEVQREAAGARLTVRHRYESTAARLRVDLELAIGVEVQWTESHYHHAVDSARLDELARAAGLRVRSVRDIDGQGFTPSSGTHVYVLERPAGG